MEEKIDFDADFMAELDKKFGKYDASARARIKEDLDKVLDSAAQHYKSRTETYSAEVAFALSLSFLFDVMGLDQKNYEEMGSILMMLWSKFLEDHAGYNMVEEGMS